MAPAPLIYLDNAATTRVNPEVAELVITCMTEDFGNPASAHHLGISAERRVKLARSQLLDAIGDPEASLGDVYWTSGGTESDALGVVGAARAAERRGKHIVVSSIEHPAVRESARSLEARGFRVTQVPVHPSGAVSAEEFVGAMGDDTTVAALMLVNNELGTCQPVAEVARLIAARNLDVHLHTDAVQALGKVAIDVGELGADSLAFAAHKIHGPKGAGALWLRKGARIEPMWSGGGQQTGVRSGTLNVPGIAGMGLATSLAASALADTRTRFARYEQILTGSLRKAGIEFRRNGAPELCAPHVVSLGFDKVPAEPLLHVLESRGVLVSAGSACAERDRKPSPVLTGIGVPPTFGTVRLSFGRDTTEAEVETAATILADAVKSFR